MLFRTRTRPTVRRAVLALAAAIVAASGCQSGDGTRPGTPETKPATEPVTVSIAPIPFAERNEERNDVYNASGIVTLEDGRFLVVDNNTNDALLELRLTPEGQQAVPIARVPLVGLPEKAVDDVEDLAMAEEGGRRYVFASPSLSVKPGSKKEAKEAKTRPSDLLRITVGADGALVAEAIPGFREWFVKNVPAIAGAADNDPDFGGLNVEGLAWDPERRALLFGVRTPVLAHAPIVVPVRVKDVGGPWSVDNLEALPAIRLVVENAGGDQGVRGMSRGPEGRGFLVTVANATSDDEAPFSVYSWDGNPDGKVRRLPVSFANKMKPEGLTVGTVGGRPAIVFVDDGGGFQVLWLDSLPSAAG